MKNINFIKIIGYVQINSYKHYNISKALKVKRRERRESNGREKRKGKNTEERGESRLEREGGECAMRV